MCCLCMSRALGLSSPGYVLGRAARRHLNLPMKRSPAIADMTGQDLSQAHRMGGSRIYRILYVLSTCISAR